MDHLRSRGSSKRDAGSNTARAQGCDSYFEVRTHTSEMPSKKGDMDGGADAMALHDWRQVAIAVQKSPELGECRNDRRCCAILTRR
jgi:hypothetical protein